MSSYKPANYIKYGTNYLIPIFNNQNYPDSGDTYKPKTYYQITYNSASIYYDLTNCVYMNVSMTLPKGLWYVSYNATINLYSNYLTVLFLSTTNSSGTNANKLSNRVSLTQTLHRTNIDSVVSQETRTVQWSGVMNVATDTTYYLYGYSATSPPANTYLFNPSQTGTTTDPDCNIILTALPLN